MGRTKNKLFEVMEENDLDSFDEAQELITEEAEFRCDAEKDDRMLRDAETEGVKG